jgi:hypothetical protein
MISGILGAMSSGALRIPKDIQDGDEMIKELLRRLVFSFSKYRKV